MPDAATRDAPSSDQAPRATLLAAVVAVVALAAFAGPLDGPWLFDDQALIAGNRFVHDLGAWPHWFSSHLWDTNYDPRSHDQFATFWRPLVLATYALDWRIGAGNSALFHVTNLLWHAAAALLAFGALSRWTDKLLPAFAAALAFAVHPTKAESVAWISGRPDLLCAAGVLLASHGISARLRGSRWGVATELLGTAIAYLSKEAAVVLPLFAAVEAWAVERGPIAETDRPRLMRAAAPQIAVAVAYLGARRLWLPIGSQGVSVGVATHAAAVLESIGRYVALALWPSDLSLGRAFMIQSSSGPKIALGSMVLGLASIAFTVAAVVVLGKRRPATAIGLALFAVTVIPVSNVVWIGYSVLVSPRFLYLPTLGLALLAADVLGSTPARLRRTATAISVALLIALFVRSEARAQDFGSEDRFWSYESARTPYYPPALLYGVSRALNERRPQRALQLAGEAQTRLTAVSPTDPSRAELVILTLRALLVLTPDTAQGDLERLRGFIADLRARRPARLESRSHAVVLDVRGRELDAALNARDLELSLLAGEISSRLADDDDALRAAKRLATDCPRCWTLMQPATLIAARAKDMPLALELEGALRRDAPDAFPELDANLAQAARVLAAMRVAPASEQPLLAAQYFSLLGAWGRAYSAAAPALADPAALDPGATASLAELAFRAGDTTTAERLLSRVLPPNAVRVRMNELGLAMHWLDAPVAP